MLNNHLGDADVQQGGAMVVHSVPCRQLCPGAVRKPLPQGPQICAGPWSVMAALGVRSVRVLLQAYY